MSKKSLTTKEMQALELIAHGHDAKSAARELAISPHTIHERLRRAREKLGVNSSREAARLFNGWDVAGTHENFVSEKFGLFDSELRSSPRETSELEESRTAQLTNTPVNATRRAIWWEVLTAKLPLRREGEREFRATTAERLHMVGDLTVRLAMAFVAICLAARVLSDLFGRG